MRHAAAATAQGRPTIVSTGYYVDLLMPAAFHYRIDPLDPEANGFTAGASPATGR